jgi:hypothetical protein
MRRSLGLLATERPSIEQARVISYHLPKFAAETKQGTSTMPDRINSMAAYLVTKAGELRRLAATQSEPTRSKMLELAEEFELKAIEMLKPNGAEKTRERC